MICPIDKSELEVKRSTEADVYHCPKCQGFWITGEQLSGRSDTKNTEFWGKEMVAGPKDFAASALRCPSCEPGKMVLKIFDGIEIDVCSRCGGVWLDRGELELIVTRFRKRREARGLVRTASCSSAGEIVQWIADLDGVVDLGIVIIRAVAELISHH